LRGDPWPDALLDRALAVDQGRALLSIVVERLGDLFEPRLCDTYQRLFTQVIERVCPELRPRIRRGNQSCAPPESADRAYVLSRVTLGADVAVTSVLMDAAKRRYPDAEIVFVGPRKSYELFEADARVRHRPAPYARGGTLVERLQASAALRLEDGIVIDSGEIFGVESAKPYIAPLSSTEPPADITVSLGVGENPAKRVDDNFERELVRALAETGASVLVDKGGSAEERARVERAVLPGMHTHEGAFAPFAAQIARSRLFVGYDSAGGHVASACGIPLISIAKGFASERAAARWRPQGFVVAGDVGQIHDLSMKIIAGSPSKRG
jgi:ADP-heptose:LPS heptosyltransferase